MTETEILELAKEHAIWDDSPELITFAQAIAQRTREECAVVCEETLKSIASHRVRFTNGKAVSDGVDMTGKASMCLQLIEKGLLK